MMKAVTFNIRCDYGQDGRNSFRFRKAGIAEQIRLEDPDLICFQEVLPHVAAWLKDVLCDYYVIGCSRSESLEDEQEAIAFKKDRFNLVTMDTFWLSKTPHVPGSRYEEQSICPRVTTEAVLYDLMEHRLFRVVNTHLDHEGTMARELGLKQIMEKITHPVSFPEASVLLMGDFNATPDQPEMAVIKQHQKFRDAIETAGGTFHDYGAVKDPEKIDYIFVQKPLEFRNVRKWDKCKDGVYLSDHYPVSVEIYSL